MKIFLTGGTGFVGNRLAEKLLSLDHEVVLLVRDTAKTKRLNNNKATIIKGDLSDLVSLETGMAGCDWVFHLAALAKPWSKDPSLYRKTNVAGTKNVIDAALKNKVKKIVITSTGATMGHSVDGNIIDESSNPAPVLKTLYEITKAEAEKLVQDYHREDTDIIIVNPTRVYGPGVLSKSNSVTRIIKQYISGYWRIMPGSGTSIGNYVFIDDVVNGYLLAAQFGKRSERYIIGGENLSFIDMFRIIGEEAGRERWLLRISLPLMKAIASSMTYISEFTGTPPVITSEWIEKYLNDSILSSNKAVKELGYSITPFRKGVAETIKWLKINNI